MHSSILLPLAVVACLALPTFAHVCTPTGNEEVQANGRPTYTGQFPHHALLVVQFGEQQETRYCSGALVDDRHVVTVAQCVQGSTEIEVHLGAHCLLQGEDKFRHVFTALHYTVRDGYDPETFVNDVAVVRFSEESIRLPPWVYPARLPEPDEQYVGQEVLSSGFGLLNYQTSSAADALQYVRLVVLDAESCQQEFNFVTPNTGRFCAQDRDQEPNCVSDVGSPLVLKEGRLQHYVLLGLSSFGQKFACNSGNPGALQEVREHSDWIREVLSSSTV